MPRNLVLPDLAAAGVVTLPVPRRRCAERMAEVELACLTAGGARGTGSEIGTLWEEPAMLTKARESGAHGKPHVRVGAGGVHGGPSRPC